MPALLSADRRKLTSQMMLAYDDSQRPNNILLANYLLYQSHEIQYA